MHLVTCEVPARFALNGGGVGAGVVGEGDVGDDGVPGSGPPPPQAERTTMEATRINTRIRTSLSLDNPKMGLFRNRFNDDACRVVASQPNTLSFGPS